MTGDRPGDDEEPELLRDKTVKIIKQTRNENLARVAAEQDLLKTIDNESSDSSFERMSNDDFATGESPPRPLDDAEFTDAEGVKWQRMHLNEASSWD